MSSAQSLENKLKALQCHFTWDLDPRKPRLITLQKILEDIGTDEGNFWLGPIYNLQGFIQNQLGSPEEALSSFNQATETFQRQKHADEGPWLMVNFGNLAWLHHLMGEDEKSQDYLSKVDALQKKKEELHPEVCAEKAWTLMKFDKEKEQQAAELFQRAIQMQPDVVEWQSSYAILRAEAVKDNLKKLYTEKLEILRSAKERDPDNLYVAALYLEARAAKEELSQGELEMFAKKVLKAPVSSYSGLIPVLRLYRNYKSKDDAVKLAKEALRTHPDSRYLKRSVAICLTRKVLSPEYNPESLAIQDVIDLWEEVKEAYHGSSTKDQITLADIYSKVDKGKADRVYKELLKKNNLEPGEQQMLYNRYAKHIYFTRNEKVESTEYHMKAAEIEVESNSRQKSLTELEKTLKRNEDPEMCRMIRELLIRLGKLPETQN
ncbi:interferon-induced protein with tetratricopeptide repeats 1-like [Fundulus heteroclitus]|uniref:interferon-induced protein with tetratricopeptide repeats 1-like n=1 Tax=Fundulus heteroclitus TaxID=8078 RepID=UPI00165ABC04|nr:interferon-induced protein with tetratricopeptide repeats 1-like [Fundulus heteroclitus]